MILDDINQLSTIPQRIVSLVPSQTELLYDLGLSEKVVGITKFCVHPTKWLQSKTIIGGTKKINLEKIKQLQPDLVIANKEENVKEEVEALAKYCNVWVTDIPDLDDALKMIADIGKLTGTQSKSVEIAETVKASFNTIQKLSVAYKTCYLIWRNPYMTIGGDTFINNMLTRCGFNNIFNNFKRYPVVQISQLKEAGCEVLLLSSEPYPFKRKDVTELQLQLPNTIIKIADGEMFSWYGSRLVKAPGYFNQLLAEIENEAGFTW